MRRNVKICLIMILFIILVGGIYYSNNYTSLRTPAEETDEYNKRIEGIKITAIGGSTMEENGNTNSMGYVIRTRNDKLVLVDGGHAIDSNFVLKYINEFGNGKIDYWFLTHGHEDHVGAFVKLINEENIEVENVCYSLLSDEWYEANDKRGYESEHALIEALNTNKEKIHNQIQCEENQQIDIDNIRVDIIRIANPEITNADNGNEASMTFKLTATDVDKSILFLGDSGTKASVELLERKDKLKSFAVQMAHHGQTGVTKEVYDAINPKLCIFNTPKWLYDNNGGEGFNTGKWQSITVRGWVEEYGADSILTYEGDQTIRLTRDGYEKIDNDSQNSQRYEDIV